MSTPDDILAGKRFFSTSGDEAEIQSLIPAMSAAGLKVSVIRGEQARTLPDFMTSAAAALGFPDYFGKNWNAFDECIDNLAWLPQRRYLLVFLDADALLADAGQEDRQLLLQVLAEAFPERDDTAGAELKALFQVREKKYK